MNLKELADRLEVLDEDAFVSLLQLEYTHDGEPGQVKAMMIDALRFCGGPRDESGAASVGLG